VVLVLTAAVFWAALLWFPEPIIGRELDQGWALALGHFLKLKRQAGVDYVWTYGPLGYLAVPAFVPGLFGLKYAWAIAFAGVASVILVRTMRLISRVAWPIWIFLVLALLPRSETLLVLVPTLAALWHVIRPRWRGFGLALTAVLLATLALVKLTLTILALGLIAILVASMPRHQRRVGSAVLVGSFLTVFLALWLDAGQKLENLPRFLYWSLEVTSGYSDAMSLRGEDSEVGAAFLMLGLVCAALGLGYWRAGLARRWLPATLVIGLGLFLCWKEGLVRQDPAHLRVFFAYVPFAAILSFQVARVRASGALLLHVALGLWILVASVRMVQTLAAETNASWFALVTARQRIAANLSVLSNPKSAVADARTQWASERERWNLPRVRARVGSDAIDIASVDQAMAFWNELTWRPRPVFQGYSAWTPRLNRLNADSLSNELAPRWVLARWMSVDRRFPAHDDGLFLLQLLERYEPVLHERDYVLFERVPAERIHAARSEIVLERRVGYDESVPLALDENARYTLAVDVETTTLGVLRRNLYQLPRISFFVRNETGVEKQFELVPRLARDEFLLSPILESHEDLARVHAGEGHRATEIRFVVDHDARSYFGDGVGVLLRRYAP
jgi:hypothetical protein